jgi:hypothetical protein
MTHQQSPYDLDLQIYPRGSDLKHWEWVIYDDDGQRVAAQGEVEGTESDAWREGRAARQRIINKRLRSRSST